MHIRQLSNISCGPDGKGCGPDGKGGGPEGKDNDPLDQGPPAPPGPPTVEAGHGRWRWCGRRELARRARRPDLTALQGCRPRINGRPPALARQASRALLALPRRFSIKTVGSTPTSYPGGSASRTYALRPGVWTPPLSFVNQHPWPRNQPDLVLEAVRRPFVEERPHRVVVGNIARLVVDVAHPSRVQLIARREFIPWIETGQDRPHTRT